MSKSLFLAKYENTPNDHHFFIIARSIKFERLEEPFRQMWVRNGIMYDPGVDLHATTSAH